MKKIVLLGLLVLMFFGFAGSFLKAEDGVPATNETSVGMLMLANTKVDAEINHEGDVFVAGQDVTLKGRIVGNLFVAGANVTLPKELEVRGSVFAAGQTLNSQAMIFGQAYFASQAIEDKSEIVGDIKAAGSNVTLAGNYNYAYLAGEKVTFSGSANYGLRMGGATNTITDEAQVTGKIKINSPKNMTPTVPEKFKENTEIVYTEADGDPDEDPTTPLGIWSSVMSMLFAFVVGITMMYVFPTGFDKIRTNFLSNTWHSLLWGILPVLMVPIGAILILIIFFPASVLFVFTGVLFWIMTFFFGTIVIYYCFGEWIAKMLFKDKRVHAVMTLLIGTFVASLFFYLLRLIPTAGFVSWIVQAGVGLFGSGAVILAIFKRDATV
jgi:hypothetical protein